MIRSTGPALALGALACLTTLAGGCVGQQPAPSPTPPADARPNIVLIFVDDMGYGDLASYGNPTIRTPHLDRMAAEGVRLTSFYAAAPVCTPSRAGLLTGRYPIRSGMAQNRNPRSTDGLPSSEVTLAEALRERGYRTAALGKWHLGHLPPYLPTSQGFDSFLGIPYSNDMDKVERGYPPVPLMQDTRIIEQPVEQTTLTRRLTHEAVRIIDGSGDRPFFIYLAHPMPHLPIYASAEFRGRSSAGLYGDVVEELDASAGRIMDALRRRGIERNTIVIFASDNGPWVEHFDTYAALYGTRPWHVGSPGPLRGSKGSTYEGGMRVPGIVRWPGGIPGGRESAEVVTAMDLYTTLLRAAGAEVPRDRPVDGKDVLPVLRGEAASSGELFYFRGAELEAVREGRWKLRVGPGGAGAPVVTELFDLNRDPGERFDVAAGNPEVVTRLRERMSAFKRELGSPGRTRS